MGRIKEGVAPYATPPPKPLTVHYHTAAFDDLSDLVSPVQIHVEDL